MNKEPLNACLKSFYTSARKQDGQFYKSSSLEALRAAIDRYLRMPPHFKQFSIVADPAFTEANRILDAFVKELRKSGKISGVVYKKAISKQEVWEALPRRWTWSGGQQWSSTASKNSMVLPWHILRKTWQENQRDMKPAMLALRATPQEKEYFELNREAPGSLQEKNIKKCTLFTHGAPRSSQELVQKCPCIPGTNWNSEMLVFEERGKPEYPEKNLSEQRREPCRQVWESHPGHTGGRQALLPLRHFQKSPSSCSFNARLSRLRHSLSHYVT